MEPTDADELRLEGRTLDGRYLLEAEVASGGMGSVWRARDLVLGRPVAVKVLHDRLAGEPDILERFRREAVAAARLSHPNVVRVFDTGIDESVCFIVMELVEGTTLHERIREDGPLPPAEAVRVVRGVLQGLAHAHREGVIHRDVKPANVLLDRSGMVKVTDFGIAKAAFATTDLTTTGDLLGTARYLAPEQVAGGTIDRRADLYSSGIVLYEALTGRTPFEGESHIATATMRLAGEPSPPGTLRPGISRGLDAVTMRALAREPDERFQTAEEMNAALERMVSPDHPRGGAAPAPAGDGRRISVFRSWMAVPLALAALAALAVVAFLIAAPLFEESPPEQAAAGQAEVRPIQIAAITSYDPFGDGGEHDEDLPLAVDGDPGTAWQTEGYTTADLGGAKPGVGVVLDLGQGRSVGALRLETDSPGFTFSVYAGADSDSFDPDGGSPVASINGQDSFTAADPIEISFEPFRGRYILVWITELVAHDEHRALVNEVEIHTPGG